MKPKPRTETATKPTTPVPTHLVNEHAQGHAEYLRHDTPEGRPRAARVDGAPLDYYLRTKRITPRQFDAGFQLFMAWRRCAARVGPIQSSYELRLEGVHAYEQPLMMSEEYEAAIRAIPNTMAALVVYNVCCVQEWARAVAVAVGINRRMELLNEGLDCLVIHFRL